MEGAVVGIAGEEERVADDVVDFGIFYVLLVSWKFNLGERGHPHGKSPACYRAGAETQAPSLRRSPS